VDDDSLAVWLACQELGVNCRLCLARRAERADAVELRAEPVFLDLQVVAGLQVYPESLGGAEVPGQPQRGVCGDAALAVDDLVDPPGRDIYRLGQPVLANAQRREELLQQDLPRCTGGMTVSSAPGSSLVIVNDLDIFRARL
jgi:hypothetical protein